MKPAKETRYVTMLAVYVPSAEALVDMLRYDACFPTHESESHKIGNLMCGTDVASDHIIRLTRVARNQLPATEARWQSFGCRVLAEQHPDETPLTDEELRLRLLHAMAVRR